MGKHCSYTLTDTKLKQLDVKHCKTEEPTNQQDLYARNQTLAMKMVR